jgi:hypothetical protein
VFAAFGVRTTLRPHDVKPGAQLLAALTLATICLVLLALVLWRLYGRPPKVRHAATTVVHTAPRIEDDSFQAVCPCGWAGPHHTDRLGEADARAEADAARHMTDP